MSRRPSSLLRTAFAVFAVGVLIGSGCNCYQAPVECPGPDCEDVDAGLERDAGPLVMDAGMTEMDGGSSDSGVPDAGASDVDAGASDSGVPDAGDRDAGAVDSGVPDAGAPDAGAPGDPDAGEVDAGEIDAGELDAGAPDAGPPDAGVIDAGIPWPIGTWDLVFVCTSSCTGTYPHTMTITQRDPATGSFSAVGFYDVDPSYTWTATGTITPSSVTFTMVYTSTNPGYRALQTGVVHANGTMSGTGTTTQGQTHDWSATRRP